MAVIRTAVTRSQCKAVTRALTHGPAPYTALHTNAECAALKRCLLLNLVNTDVDTFHAITARFSTTVTDAGITSSLSCLVALSVTCRDLHTMMAGELGRLKAKEKAALMRRLLMQPAQLEGTPLLYLSARGLTPAVFRLLTVHFSLSHVKALQITSNLADAGLAGLAAVLVAGSFSNLTSLCLDGNRFGPKGVTVLMQALRPRGSLGSLGMTSGKGESHSHLNRAAPLIDSLTQLRLSYNWVGDVGCAALADAAHDGALRALRSLMLRAARIGDLGCERLAIATRAGALASLTDCDLSRNDIGNAGAGFLVTAMCEGGALPSLSKLEIGSLLSDDGLASLALLVSSDAAGELEHLYFEDNHDHATEGGREGLRHACELSHVLHDQSYTVQVKPARNAADFRRTAELLNRLSLD